MTTTTTTTAHITTGTDGASAGHTSTGLTRRHRLARLLFGVGIAGAATIVGAGSASAMTMQEWQARCAAEGGEWSAYFIGSTPYYECTWITSSGYSYDVFVGRGRNVRLNRTCGGTIRTESCIVL